MVADLIEERDRYTTVTTIDVILYMVANEHGVLTETGTALYIGSSRKWPKES